MEKATPPLRVIGYIRVSTVDQSANGVSLEAQKARIAAWREARGGVDAGTFVDAGISGGSTNGRPGLAQALTAAENFRGSVVVVYSLSRLARSTRDALDISARLEKSGVNLVSLTESIDTTTPMGKFFFTVMAGIATLERDLVSQRTKMAFAHKRAQHQKTSCRVPYGWNLEADGKTLTPNLAETGALSTMRTLRHQGLSYSEIARRLHAAGIKTKLGHEFWQLQTIKRLVERGDA